jgi:hypothetical protein
VARRVILDAGVIIAFERGKLDIDAVLGSDDDTIAPITAMELLVGVERASDAHKQRRALHVEAVFGKPRSAPPALRLGTRLWAGRDAARTALDRLGRPAAGVFEQVTAIGTDVGSPGASDRWGLVRSSAATALQLRSGAPPAWEVPRQRPPAGSSPASSGISTASASTAVASSTTVTANAIAPCRRHRECVKVSEHSHT